MVKKDICRAPAGALQISDEDFVSRIESSQIFYKGDTLRCDVRTTQSHNLNSGNLRFSQ